MCGSLSSMAAVLALASIFAVGIAVAQGSDRGVALHIRSPLWNPPDLSEIAAKEDPKKIGELLNCVQDLGWYYLYISQLVEDISNLEVIISIGGNVIVNSTVGELAEQGGVGAGGLIQQLTITIDYQNITLVEITAAELIGYLTNTVSIEEIIGIPPVVSIAGDEVLDIMVNFNLAGVSIGQIAIGEIITESGDQTQVILWITNILTNGLQISTGNPTTINGLTIQEIIAIFGLGSVTGPIIDIGSLTPLTEFPNLDKIRPVPGWVIQVLDSSGVKSLPSNYLRGNTWTIGNFNQCRNLKAVENNTAIIQNPIDGTNVTLQPTTFNGMFCFAEVAPLSVPAPRLPIFPGLLPTLFGSVSGVCLPDSCSQEILNSEEIMGLIMAAQLPVQRFKNCSTNETRSLSTAEIITMILLFLLGVILIAGTIVDAGRIMNEKKTREKKEKIGETTMMKMITSFSIIKNTQVILDLGPALAGKAKKNPDVIECLFGMRFISMTWVLLSHTYSSAAATERETDPTEFFSVFTKWSYQPLTNGFPSVDTFFFMSGLLVAYVMLKKLTRYGFSMGFVPQMYIHRYLRLTPLYALVMLVTYAFFERVGSGPFWPSVYGDYLQGCEKKWWHNLLYISTILSPTQECLGHGWYLTNDMLYFLAAPFLVLPLYLSGSWALGYSVLVLGASFGIAASEHLTHDAPGALAWSVLQQSNQVNYMKYIYFKPHTRFGVYVVGIIAGFWLFKARGKRIQLSGGVVLLGWMTAIGTGLAIVYGLFEPAGTKSTEDALLAYGVLHRQAWGFALTWVVFACTQGYGGFINTFLSWSAFKPLSNLAYSSYLVHFYVVGWNLLSSKTQRRLDAGMQIYNFIGNLIITHMFAFCTAVAVEYPLMRISNIIMEEIPRRLARKFTRKGPQPEDYYRWKQNRKAERISIEDDGGIEMKKL